MNNLIWERLGYKTIFAYNLPRWFKLTDGVDAFKQLNCPVDKCRLSTFYPDRKTADLILFFDNYVPANYPRPEKQIFALYYDESPPHTKRIRKQGNQSQCQTDAHFHSFED